MQSVIFDRKVIFARNEKSMNCREICIYCMARKVACTISTQLARIIGTCIDVFEVVPRARSTFDHPLSLFLVFWGQRANPQSLINCVP